LSLRNLVLLPGMDGTGILFKQFLEVLPENLNPIVVPLPNDPTLNYQDLCAFLNNKVEALDQYAIIAESFSGPLALQYASRYPSKIKAVALCASFISNPLPKYFQWIQFILPSIVWKLQPSNWMLKKILLGKDCSDELLESVRTTLRSVNPKVIASRVRQIFNLKNHHLASRIAIPILYLAGSHDRLVGQRGLDQLNAHYTNITSVTIDGPHMLLQRRPLICAEEILKFLDIQGTK